MGRRRFSDEFKAKVALETIKGQRTAIELAQEFGVHVSQIDLWKRQLLEAAPKVFTRGKDQLSLYTLEVRNFIRDGVSRTM